MKVCTCLVLFRILAHTNLISGITQRDLKSAYLIQGKIHGDAKHIHNVTHFLTDKNNISQHDFRPQRVTTFTGFIVEAVKILNTYGDTAFEDFFHILDSEISSYHYRGGKFSELMKNDDSKQLLSSTFNMIREQPVSVTRDNINAIADSIRDETNDDNVKELLDYINTLYRNAREKFQNVLVDLKHYRNSKSIRTHIKLQKLIRFAVRTILFDHYSELDLDTRQELKGKLQAFWESTKTSSASVEFHNHPAVRLGMNNVNILEKFMNAYIGPDLFSKKTTKFTAETKRFSSSEQTSDENSQDKTTKKTEKTEESSDESLKQILNYTSPELQSGQSFDSSSNSIKKSQERHELFNTQRYMTLYAEEITTTKKTKFILRATNTTQSRIQRQPTTKQHPKDISDIFLMESMKKLSTKRDTDSEAKQDVSIDSRQDSDSGLSLETNYLMRAKQNPGKQTIHGKPNVEPKFVANSKNAGIFIHDNTMKPTHLLEPVRQTKTVATKTIIHPRTKQVQAKTRLQIKTPLKKTFSRYLEPYASISKTQFNNFKKSIKEPRLPDEGLSEEKFTDKYKNLKSPSRRSGNDSNIVSQIFNEYVINRLNALEKELKELKQLKGINVETRNDTNSNNTEDKKDIHDKGTAKIPMDTVPLSAVNNKEINATVTNTNDTANSTTIADTEVTTNNITIVDPIEVENATLLENIATTVTVAVSTDYPDSDPSYYNKQDLDHLGFFEHVNDGLDLRM